MKCLVTFPCKTGSSPARHFAYSVDEVFAYSLCDLDPSNMVGISIYIYPQRGQSTVQARRFEFQEKGSDFEKGPVERD